MKKTIALALALLLCFSVFAQGASEAKTDTPALKVGMVTDSGTMTDHSTREPSKVSRRLLMSLDWNAHISDHPEQQLQIM